MSANVKKASAYHLSVFLLRTFKQYLALTFLWLQENPQFVERKERAAIISLTKPHVKKEACASVLSSCSATQPENLPGAKLLKPLKCEKINYYVN